jgi:hypothetical protein
MPVGFWWESQSRETAKYGHQPSELGTKNDGAGEDQQQVIRPTDEKERER